MGKTNTGGGNGWNPLSLAYSRFRENGDDHQSHEANYKSNGNNGGGNHESGRGDNAPASNGKSKSVPQDISVKIGLPGGEKHFPMLVYTVKELIMASIIATALTIIISGYFNNPEKPESPVPKTEKPVQETEKPVPKAMSEQDVERVATYAVEAYLLKMGLTKQKLIKPKLLKHR